MEKLIIGLSGKIGSGKNYIAEEVLLPQLFQYFTESYSNIHLVPYYFSFGDQLKVECLSRIPYKNIDKDTGMYNFFVEKDQKTRDILQKYGTENGRNVYHEDVWIRAIDTWISIQSSRLEKINKNRSIRIFPIFIIADVRFVNEANYVLSNNGILIRVNAPNRSYQRVSAEAKNDPDIIKKIISHSSENSLDDFEFQYLINNDEQTLNELNKNVKLIIESFLTKFNINS